MHRMPRRNLLALATVVVLAVTLTFASTAVAADDLLGELPGSDDTLVVVDFEKLQDSPVFDRVFGMLAEQPEARRALSRLDDDLGVDPRTDLEALVMTSDSPPLSTNLLQQSDPTQAVESAAAGHDGKSLMLVRGDFDAAELLESAAEQLDGDAESDEDQRYVTTAQFEVHQLDDRTVAIATGSTDELAQTRQQLQGERQGISSGFQSAMQRLGDSSGMYMMIEPTIEDPGQFREETGASASFAAVSVDLSDAVRIGTLMTLENEQQVQQTAEELDEMRDEAGSNPMAGLLGFGPLLENLSIEQDGQDLLVRTSMTNPEANRLIDQVGSILQTEQQLEQPLEGDGFDDGDDDDSDDDGADADFN